MPSPTELRIIIGGSRRAPRQVVRSVMDACPECSFKEVLGAAGLELTVQRTGTHAVVLIHPEFDELSWEYLRQERHALQGGRVPVVAVVRGASGHMKHTKFPGIDACVPVQEIDTLPRVIRDLLSRPAERVEAEMQKISTDALRESQKLISIGRLTAEISHEINNPLESVGNLLYLALQEPRLPEKAMGYLQSAERELERVVQISKQTLSFYRESVQPIKIRMASLMDEVVGLYGRRIAQKKLDLRRDYLADEGVTALPGEMRQVLSNLVTNAIEASQSGGRLHLRIRAGHRWQGNVRAQGLRISIADSGEGIPASARQHLGQLFFTTKGQSGTGLGLYVTRTIVNRYGGSMKVRSRTSDTSQEGVHGTVFSVFLPFDPAEQHEMTTAINHVGGRQKVTEISRHPAHANNPNHVAKSVKMDSSPKPGRQREG